MLRDRLIDFYYDAREFIIRHRRLVMPAVLLLCVMITVVAAFWLRRRSRDSEEASGEIALGADEIELELNAYPEVNELIEAYYEATADGDAEAVASLCSSVSDEDSIRIQELGSYIDTYTTIDVYTKTGPIDNSYIAYVYTRLTLVDHDWELPGMQTMYICPREDGSLFINNSETQSEEVSNYISLASLQDDVVDLNNQIAAEYNELLADDEELSEYLDQMASLIDISVGRALAALNAERTEESDTAVYVEVIADDVNVRKSASAEGTRIGSVSSGEQYQLVEELSDGWTEILYNGTNAYIKSEYVTVIEAETEAEEDSDTEEGSGTETDGSETESDTVEGAEETDSDAASP